MIAWQQDFVTVASALSAIAINALWQDALLVLCVWLMLRAWPRINAATRYTVWSATLLAAFALPVATTLAFFTPSAPQAASVAASLQQRSAAIQAPPRAAAPVPAPVRHSVATSKAAASTAAAPRQQFTARLPERLRLTLPVPVALGVFALWVVLAGYALVRLAIGLVRLEQLKHDALPLPVEYRDAMPQWLRANKGARDVRLCVSDETDVPVAVGLFDAMILVPRSLLDRLSQPEVDQICLHELAHLRRADDWTNGFQRVINALLGWNPAAQFIGQQLDLEREVACDDWVLSFVHTVRPYALCLTKMAETASWPRQMIPAPGVFATRKHISLRIERLLGAGRNMATNLAPAPAAAAVAVVGAIGLVIAVVAPSIASPPMTEPVTAVAAQAPVPTVTPAHAAKPVLKKQAHLSAPAAAGVAPAQPPRSLATEPPRPAETAGPLHVARVAPVKIVPVTVVPAKPRVEPYDRLNETVSKAVAANVDAAIAASTKIGPAAAARATAAIGSMKLAQLSSGRTCSGCDFHNVDWSGRDMHGVNYVGVDLSGARLAGTNFSGGTFSGVDFRKAVLHNASFRNAHLIGCDFSGADLTGVDFGGAKISGCQFTDARLNSAELRDVLNSCTGCDFTRANLSGLNLSNVRASGDDFTRADLSGVNFSGAQLTGIDFSHARMDGVNLSGATLSGCDVSGVDLSRVDLSKTKLIGMDLSRP